MALVKYGGGITQMSGSIAGNTFARNRYGNYVRSRTKPVNPNSDAQVKIRSAIAQLSEEWYETLTADQRTAWNAYATAIAMKNKLGETIKLSGFNHFIRSNSIRLYVGLGIIAAGPAILTLPDKDPAFSIAISAATQVITVTYNDALDWNSEDGAYMHLFHGTPQNPTRNFFAGPWKLTTGIVGNSGAPPASPATPPCVYVVSEGQKAWVYARIHRADGRLSEKFQDSCVVGA